MEQKKLKATSPCPLCGWNAPIIPFETTFGEFKEMAQDHFRADHPDSLLALQESFGDVIRAMNAKNN